MIKACMISMYVSMYVSMHACMSVWLQSIGGFDLFFY